MSGHLLSNHSNFNVIGTRPVRHDGLDKVTGRAVYGADVRLPGQAWAEVVRSPHAHAVIKAIDATEALKVTGVFGVVTAADFPAPASYGSDSLRWQVENIMARDRAKYEGHAVAAIAAVDRNTAIEAARLVRVDYEPLPAIMSVEQAMTQGAELVSPGTEFGHNGVKATDTNVASHLRLEVGDPGDGFSRADFAIERTARFQMVHQGYIEPHNATVLWDEEGRLSVWSSTQGMFGVRDQLKLILQVPESRITVHSVEIGGGFGGKTIVYLPPVAALLSKKLGRPVKMVMDRSSIFRGTGPASGGLIRIKMGVTDNGRLIAAEADVRMEAGAYPGSAVELPASWCFSSYDIPNLRSDAFDVLVNKPKSHAYRAPGLPQAAFCVEQVVDEICIAKGWDPLRFRIENAAREGTRRTDGVPLRGIGMAQTLAAVHESEHWNSAKPESSGGKLRGRGIAVGYCPHIGGKSSVRMSLNYDGTVSLSEGSQDIGGTRVALAMIAAEALGLKAGAVRPSIPGTDDIGYTETTDGSRVVNATGQAVWDAAATLIDEMKSRVGILFDSPSEKVSFDRGEFTADNGSSMTIQELASRIDETGGPIEALGHADLSAPTNGFAAHICDLEIDAETGKTDIIRYTAVQDAGKAVHPSYVEGQMQGGAVQGIGWALNEEYVFDDSGVMRNSSFLDYRMPTAFDLPMIDTIIVEVPNPLHPIGARGVAETPLVPPLGAIANAIHDATGRRFYEQPINPGRIVKALFDH